MKKTKMLCVESMPGSDRIRCRVYDVTRTQSEEEFDIDYENAWQVLGNLVGMLRLLGEGRARSVAAGDCRRCKNYRLVNVMRLGRDWLEHCPKCRLVYDNATVHMADGSRRML